MKNKIRYSLYCGFVVAIVLSLVSSCSKPVSDLDQVKDFAPENKNFKSSLMSLHFITEIYGISQVKQAYEQTFSSLQLPSTAHGIPDGIYTGESPIDAFDYLHKIKVEIKNGNFISVDYNEMKTDGIGKQEDHKYCEEMKISGTTPALAYPLMEKQLLETQNSLEIDAVSGATYSLYRMQYALSIALMKGKLNNSK